MQVEKALRFQHLAYAGSMFMKLRSGIPEGSSMLRLTTVLME